LSGQVIGRKSLHVKLSIRLVLGNMSDVGEFDFLEFRVQVEADFVKILAATEFERLVFNSCGD
jgi:hypothetical protein